MATDEFDSDAVVFCCDIGSVKQGAFGWVRTEVSASRIRGGKDIDACESLLQQDLRAGRRVALGIESPLFLPIPAGSNGLSRGRKGDGDRSCFAPAGGYVATLGVHELAYLLRNLTGVAATTDAEAWLKGGPRLLVWEAFVSGPAHTQTNDHTADAATAAAEFVARYRRQTLVSDVTLYPKSRSFSLAGAVLLWAGQAGSARVLESEPLVVKPSEPFVGVVEPVDSPG